MLRPDFSAELLEEAHQRGIYMAVETASNFPWEFVEKVLLHDETMLHATNGRLSSSISSGPVCQQRSSAAVARG